MQDATNLETTYTYSCECMYGMYYARWHEKQWDEYYALYIVT